MIWTSRNCDRCWKASRLKDDGDYTVFRCKVDEEITSQLMGDMEISERTYNITQMLDCPYRQEKRLARASVIDTSIYDKDTSIYNKGWGLFDSN